MGITRFWPVALALAACGAGPLGDAGGGEKGIANDGAADPLIETRCHDSAELSRQIAETHCECLVAAGELADQAECVADRSPRDEAVDCLCSVYARYPESDAFIDCFVPRQQAHADCVADALCDQAKLDACDKMVGSLPCQPPQDAADDVAASCELP